MELNKKAQIIMELKQKLKDGEKIFFDDEGDNNNLVKPFIGILGSRYKTYIKLEEGLLCKYSNDNLEKKLEISEVTTILDDIAERKVKELEELDAVTNFLNS